MILITKKSFCFCPESLLISLMDFETTFQHNSTRSMYLFTEYFYSIFYCLENIYSHLTFSMKKWLMLVPISCAIQYPFGIISMLCLKGQLNYKIWLQKLLQFYISQKYFWMFFIRNWMEHHVLLLRNLYGFYNWFASSGT